MKENWQEFKMQYFTHIFCSLESLEAFFFCVRRYWLCNAVGSAVFLSFLVVRVATRPLLWLLCLTPHHPPYMDACPLWCPPLANTRSLLMENHHPSPHLALICNNNRIHNASVVKGMGFLHMTRFHKFNCASDIFFLTSRDKLARFE